MFCGEYLYFRCRGGVCLTSHLLAGGRDGAQGSSAETRLGQLQRQWGAGRPLEGISLSVITLQSDLQN